MYKLPKRHFQRYSSPLNEEIKQKLLLKNIEDFKLFWANNRLFREREQMSYINQQKQLKEKFNFVTRADTISDAEAGLMRHFNTLYLQYICLFWNKSLIDMCLTDYSTHAEYADTKPLKRGIKAGYHYVNRALPTFGRVPAAIQPSV